MIKKLIAALLITTLIPTTVFAATPKPTQAQIDAAKKLEDEKKAAADAAESGKAGRPGFGRIHFLDRVESARRGECAARW